MRARRIHLVSNAHLDPVWLWEWQEGAGEALSTFRQAAEFCETRKGYIFCHNEAVLYRWIEEHEPPLFRRIRKLVRAKKWHIMGGWYVQPDCNMPSGESFVRQALLGRRYFAEKFGVEPRTAVNLDPFGHTRGLVQILAKSGYTAYLCCRPGNRECPLPGDEFVWVGYDGSEVLATRASAHYCSVGGKERERLEKWLAENPAGDPVIHLWGIGNHGGGPSRKDLADLDALAGERPDLELVHSTPDAYFEELGKRRADLPRREKDLNPWAVGCYTSMVRVKQGHRRLENELFSAEKMATTAWLQGLMPYPQAELEEVMRDLAFVQFHDILPGSAIPAGEDGALRMIGHGLEILSRLKAKAFFALAAGEPKAAPGEIPIFVFNPHPHPVRGLVECEFEPWEPNLRKDPLVPQGLRPRPGPAHAGRKGGEQSQRRVAQAGRLRGRARPGPAEQVLLPAGEGPGKERARDRRKGRLHHGGDGRPHRGGQRPHGTPRRLSGEREGPDRAGRLPAAGHPRQRRPVGHEGPQLPGRGRPFRPGHARRGGPVLGPPRRRPRAGPGHRGRPGPHGRRGRLRLRRVAAHPPLQDPEARDRDRGRRPRVLGRAGHDAQARPDAPAEDAPLPGAGRLRRRRAAGERRRGRGPEVAGPGLGRGRRGADRDERRHLRLGLGRDRIASVAPEVAGLRRRHLGGPPGRRPGQVHPPPGRRRAVVPVLARRRSPRRPDGGDRPPGPCPQRVALRSFLLPAGTRKEGGRRRRRRGRGRRGRGLQEVRRRPGRRHPPLRADGPAAAGRRQSPGPRRAHGGPPRRLRDQDLALRQADAGDSSRQTCSSESRGRDDLEGAGHRRARRADPRPRPLRGIRGRLRHGRAPARPRDVPAGQGQVPDRVSGRAGTTRSPRAGSRTTSPSRKSCRSTS